MNTCHHDALIDNILETWKSKLFHIDLNYMPPLERTGTEWLLNKNIKVDNVTCFIVVAILMINRM